MHTDTLHSIAVCNCCCYCSAHFRRRPPLPLHAGIPIARSTGMDLDLSILLPYLIVSTLVTLWGLNIVIKKKKTKSWPTTQDVIDKFDTGEDEGELFPRITFGYDVAGWHYRSHLSHSGGTPPPEYVIIYTEKYTAGAKEQVYYDPANPENATIEPGAVRGDWIVFAIGLASTLVGVGAGGRDI